MTLNVTDLNFTEGGAAVEIVRISGTALSAEELDFQEHGVMLLDAAPSPDEKRFVPYSNIVEIHQNQ